MFQHVDPRWMDHPGWWGSFTGFIPLLLFLVVIGVLVWAVFRVTSHPRTAPPGPWVRPAPPAPTQDRALEEVRVQYARGEITREEFLQRTEDLSGVRPGQGPPGQAG